MKLTKITTIALAAILGVSTFSFLPAAAVNSTACDSSVPTEVRRANGCDNNANQLPGVIVSIINAIIFVLGIVAVIFIIIGGINYMTSAGDPSKTQKARNTILYAAIGLIVCVLAFAIVNFVIGTILKQ